MKRITSFLLCLATAAPAAGADPPLNAAARHYLVELSCAPDDADAVANTMRMALALREDKSTVTLFIDVAAVSVARTVGDARPSKRQLETDSLFEKLRAAGVVVLVCPHCAEKHGLPAKSLRRGLRFTSKEELEVERKRADKVFEYRPAEPSSVEV